MPGPPDCGARAHPVANGFGSRMDSLGLAIVHAQQPSSAHSLIKTAVALAGVILLTALPALPHDFAFTEVTVLIERQGAYRIDLRMDVDALALGVSPTTDSAEVAAELQAMTPDGLAEAVENARQTVQRRVRLRFDGVKQTPAITFPQRGTKLALENEIPTLLGLTARLSGGVPAGAQAMTFGVSRAFKAVHLTLLDQRTGRASRQVLGVGEDSAPYPLQGEGGAEGWGKVAFRYLVLGFQHILPAGSDHILFVLGLFLLGRRFRPLLWQVTAFTLAHSVTLALSSYDLVSLPSRPVESLIALLHRLCGRREYSHHRAEALAAGGGVRIRPVARAGLRRGSAGVGSAGTALHDRPGDLQSGGGAGATRRAAAGLCRGGMVPAETLVSQGGGPAGFDSDRRHRPLLVRGASLRLKDKKEISTHGAWRLPPSGSTAGSALAEPAGEG